MNKNHRVIKEDPIYQGVDEEITYTLDTEPWGGTPTVVSVVVKNKAGEDVSATVLDGSASVASDVITLPVLESLTAEMQYRLEIKFTSGGSVEEAWATVIGQT